MVLVTVEMMGVDEEWMMVVVELMMTKEKLVTEVSFDDFWWD